MCFTVRRMKMQVMRFLVSLSMLTMGCEKPKSEDAYVDKKNEELKALKVDVQGQVDTRSEALQKRTEETRE